MSYKIASIASFDKQVKRLSKKHPSLKKDLVQLAEGLMENPEQGESLGKGFYKIRMAITSKGQGKSGGARVITCVKVTITTVYLTAIYDKSEIDSMSASELSVLLKQIL